MFNWEGHKIMKKPQLAIPSQTIYNCSKRFNQDDLSGYQCEMMETFLCQIGSECRQVMMKFQQQIKHTNFHQVLLKKSQIDFLTSFLHSHTKYHISNSTQYNHMGHNHSQSTNVKSTLSTKELKQDQNLSYGVCHFKGKRRFMEDASLSIGGFQGDNTYLFGVFDGHGGPEVAQFVRNHLGDQLKLSPEFQNQDYGSALISAYHGLDALLESQPGRKELYTIIDYNIDVCNRLDLLNDLSAGCTANVCFISENEIYVANAGDSRCVGCSHGRAVALSIDHKPTDKVQLKRVKQAGGEINKKGRISCKRSSINVSRSIGDLDYKQNKALSPSEQMVISTPDVIHCRREEMDFIVLGCDGVWEKYSNEAIVERILDRLERNMEPHNILEELFKELLKKDEEGYSCSDNLSAILVVFQK